MEDVKTQMRQDIMICIKANGLAVTGEMWLSLVFMSESQLRGMCRELHIITPERIQQCRQN